jgi:hypothetical protein
LKLPLQILGTTGANRISVALWYIICYIRAQSSRVRPVTKRARRFLISNLLGLIGVLILSVSGKKTKRTMTGTKKTPLSEGEVKSLLADPQARAKFEATAESWEDERRPLVESIRASERLTERDFAVRINAS